MANVIDRIIAQRQEVMVIATAHGVSKLKLFGSVLARQEHSNSDIDFVAVFDSLIDDEVSRWEEVVGLEIALEEFFNRPVQILDPRHIVDFFRPVIEKDAIDIIQLEVGKNYPITPKSSKQYFIMLDKLLKEYEEIDFKASEYADTLFTYIADRLSFQFSRLIKLQDNDLCEYEGFSFIEVLYICDKLFYTFDDQDPNDLARFKELLPAIKEYVAVRLPVYMESRS